MAHGHTCNAGSLGPSLAEYCSASTFVAFATLLNSLLRSKEEISGLCDRVKSIEPDNVYDFVVIGSGAGGSAVASRLSDISGWKTLLIESGPDASVVSGVPLLYESLIGGSVIDWNYSTVNESYGCLSMKGSCAITAGKLLGGSTSHNAMLYSRGSPSDYDSWAAAGNEGWSYKEVLPYFKKAEDNGEIKRVGRKYHGTGGPLSVERMRYLPAFGRSVLAASIEAGIGVTEDVNGAVNTGFSIMQTLTEKGVRCSSATAYLRPVGKRTNLHISLNTTGTKVIIKNGAADSVQYYKNGKFRTVDVRKEVILSAGNIESPKLLLLSGIGPKKHLKSVGIKVVHDLPGVGENFHDQMTFNLPFTINDTDAYEYNRAVVAEYLATQTGPLSSTGTTSVSGFTMTNLTTPYSPDIRMGFVGYSAACASGKVGALRSSGRRAIRAYMANLRPQSRGRVTLASNNPHDYPLIWANYLEDPVDVDRMIQGIELLLAMTKTKAMRAYDMTMSYTPIKACRDHTFPSYEYWVCALRHDATSDIHHSGTCKMGPSSDPQAVVDPRLRVHGIKGLRVVDTSIMPQVISGNTGAPTMMIGEKAADFIKEDWGKKSPGKTRKQRTL